jgi:hypothetical protein
VTEVVSSIAHGSVESNANQHAAPQVLICIVCRLLLLLSLVLTYAWHGSGRLCSSYDSRDQDRAMSDITIIIASPHGQVRRALRSILECKPDFEIIGEAADGPTTRALADALQPRVLLIDAKLGGYDTLGLIAALQAALIKPRLIAICDDHLAGHFSMGAGAAGYVLLRDVGRCLAETIHRVAGGEVFRYPDTATYAGAAARPNKRSGSTSRPARR